MSAWRRTLAAFRQRHQQALRRRPRARTTSAFDVRAGEVHGLIGANGAGKSTLIGVLSGAMTPDAGTLDGQRPARAARQRHRRAPRRHRGGASGTDALPRPHGRGEHRRHGAADRAAPASSTAADGGARCAACSTASVSRIDLSQAGRRAAAAAAPAGRDRPRALRRRQHLRPRRADLVAVRPGGGRALRDHRRDRRGGRRRSSSSRTGSTRCSR